MPDNSSVKPGKSLPLWDKIVFTGSVIGVIVMVAITFYKNHVSKEIILENNRLKNESLKKDSIIKEQNLMIESLKGK